MGQAELGDIKQGTRADKECGSELTQKRGSSLARRTPWHYLPRPKKACRVAQARPIKELPVVNDGDAVADGPANRLRGPVTK